MGLWQQWALQRGMETGLLSNGHPELKIPEPFRHSGSCL
jgi:hypothetical protein